MRELFVQVDSILDSVDFGAIWPGFSKLGFALFNRGEVCLRSETIPYDNRFLGNTSIDYNGEQIAIWHVDGSEQDLEILASNLVHEMFHAFQHIKGETRGADDLVMLDYPYTVENLTVRHAENRLLADAFAADGVDEKKALMHRFMAARKHREGIIGGIIEQEYQIETIEGMAEYAGCMALRQLSVGKYNARVAESIENLRALDERFYHARRMLYYSGSLLCLLLNDIGGGFHHEIGQTRESMFRLMSEGVAPKAPEIGFDTAVLRAETQKYMLGIKRQFDEFHLNHCDEVSGDFTICGYDPMNMIKMNGELLCSRFIMLREGSGGQPQFVQGPVVVRLRDGSEREAQGYVK